MWGDGGVFSEDSHMWGDRGCRLNGIPLSIFDHK